MDWWQNLLISVSVAVVSGVISFLVAYCKIKSAKEDMQKKYQNENLLHIKHMSFDKEFSIFQELCGKFFTMARDVMDLFPEGAYFEPLNEKDLKGYRLTLYKRCEVSYNEANYAVNQYACFIDENIYKEFLSIKFECYRQIRAFFVFYILPDSDTSQIGEYFVRTINIRNSIDELIVRVRNYIKGFELKAMN